MRRRRLGRCLLRADLAIEDGDVEQARSALAEAREIGGDSPALSELEERFHQIQETASESSRRRLQRMRPLLAAAGGLLLLASLFAFGLFRGHVWRTAEVGQAGIAPGGATVDARPGSTVSAQAADTASRAPRLRILSETVSAPAATPRVVLDEPATSTPPRPGPPIASAQPAPQPATTAAATAPEPPADTRVEAPPDPPASMTAPDARPAPPPASEPVSAQRIPDPVPIVPQRPAPPEVSTAADIRPAPPREPAPAGEAVRAVDDSAGIRATLQRYAAAYSRLDAAAASAVWPAVDRGALERAFDGLVSQNVSLGTCDVRVNGAAARATCAGSATWQPKVGGRARTEPRRWNFELRKDGDAWQIERAIARGGE